MGRTTGHSQHCVTSLRLTHVGGPTLLIEVGPWRLLTDPTLDPPGRRYRLGWGTGSTKLAGPAIDAAAVQPIDAILLTHDHHDDNLDDAGRELLPSAEVVVTTSSGARRLGAGARGLDPWQSTLLEAPGRPSMEESPNTQLARLADRRVPCAGGSGEALSEPEDGVDRVPQRATGADHRSGGVKRWPGGSRFRESRARWADSRPRRSPNNAWRQVACAKARGFVSSGGTPGSPRAGWKRSTK